MQPEELCEEQPIGNDCIAEVRQFFSMCHLPGKAYEYSRIETQCSVNVAIFIGCFSGVWFAAVNKEDLAGTGSVPGALVCVLLDAFFHQADHQMLVRMTREPVLHVMGVHSLARVRTAETMNSSPLFRLRHGPIILGFLLSASCFPRQRNSVAFYSGARARLRKTAPGAPLHPIHGYVASDQLVLTLRNNRGCAKTGGKEHAIACPPRVDSKSHQYWRVPKQVGAVDAAQLVRRRDRASSRFTG